MKQLSPGMHKSNVCHSSIRRPGPAVALLAAATLGAMQAQAHPGHPLAEEGLAHIVSSPYHLAILAGSGLALWLGARFVHRRIPRRLMQFGGAAAVMGAAVLWGLHA